MNIHILFNLHLSKTSQTNRSGAFCFIVDVGEIKGHFGLSASGATVHPILVVTKGRGPPSLTSAAFHNFFFFRWGESDRKWGAVPGSCSFAVASFYPLCLLPNISHWGVSSACPPALPWGFQSSLFDCTFPSALLA